MKRSLFIGIMAAALLVSCDNSNNTAQQMEQQEKLNAATREELEAAISERDELLDVINGIVADIDSIKNVERVITINGVGEGNRRSSVNNDLAAIKATLAERRKKLAELEEKLKDSKLSNSKLLSTIETLKKQIDSQEAQIAQLTESLNQANRRIAQLDNTVDSLNTTVSTVTTERNIAQEEAIRQANIANTCYYCIGSNKELKAHDIVEGGFLRKTKIMEGDFDKSYFTKADKRMLSVIPLHSKKAKVLTKQPEGSYEIVEVGGQKELHILNANSFWSISNYVVIQID